MFWGESESGSYDFNSDISVEFCADFDVSSYLTVDHEIDICVDISGNEASFAIDVQAFGDDSATELNLVVVVNDDWSSITATGYAAVA
jgi:hypothetical protein